MSDISDSTLIMVLLAIFLPPVAVLIVDGLSVKFIISIVLTLMFGLPGMIFALWCVLS